LDASAAPTNLPPEHEGKIEEGVITVIATNVGDATLDGEAEVVTVEDTLPPGLKAVKMEGRAGRQGYQHPEEFAATEMTCPSEAELEEGKPLSCTYAAKLAPFESLLVRIFVKVEEPEGTV